MKATALVVAAIALLAGLFVWMRPAPAPLPAAVPASAVQAPGPAAANAPETPAAPIEQTIELVVQQGKLVSGPAVIAVQEGTPLRIVVTSNHADELHLHGYDLSLKLAAGKPGELVFVADRSGRFEYELHHAHADLGALEVQPR